MKHIILTGFMGAGKTTVGKLLAQSLGCPFFDTDQLIQQEAKMSVSQIFAEKGEEVFRSLETAVLRGDWTRETDWVLSVGGGLPMRQENRKRLKAIGTVVYLRVRSETVLERLAGDTSRPLLQGGDVAWRVDSLLAQRGPVYEEGADLVVDVDRKTPKAIEEEIKRITNWQLTAKG